MHGLSFTRNCSSRVFDPSSPNPQVIINAGVAPPDRMAPCYLSHLDLGESVAALVERRSSSHTVFNVESPSDLEAILLDGKV